MAPNLSEIFKLSVPERILLVEAIWDSIASENEKNNSYNLNAEQILFLNEELENYGKNPAEEVAWLDIKRKLLNK